MRIKHTDTYTLIDCKDTTITAVKQHLITEKETYTAKNIVLDFSKNFNIEIQEFSLFLEIAQDKTQTSFVIIKNVDVDDFPEELNIVPTLQEAQDIIEMETIERALGF